MPRFANMNTDPPTELLAGEGFTIGEFNYGPATLTAWSAEELAEIGVLEIGEPSAVPAGSRKIGETLVVVDDAPVLQLELETVPLADLKAEAVAHVRTKRWTVETGGVSVAGQTINTDENGQAKLTGAVMLFDKDPTLAAVDWEAQPGVWVTIDQATAEALGVAVGRHVQACFTHARQLSEAIASATDAAALSAIDINAGWPPAQA